jgi:uncharacterized membrane protein HdeD (DUF308 family)
VRNRFVLFLGAVQVAVGVFIALRPLVGSGAPLTRTRVLDMAFAAFFLIRGIMNMRVAMRAAPRDPAPPPPPTP